MDESENALFVKNFKKRKAVQDQVKAKALSDSECLNALKSTIVILFHNAVRMLLTWAIMINLKRTRTMDG